MSFKVVLDSDGLIKLVKAEVLETMITVWTCLISRAVYEETVERGLRAAYPDATRIEQILQTHRIDARTPVVHPKAQRILKGTKVLGRGETEALHLFFAENADAILSDDARLLTLLNRAGVPSLPPALAVVHLALRRELAPEKALVHLRKMKPLINPGVYRRAHEDLQAMKTL